jgi:hypothetical protein
MSSRIRRGPFCCLGILFPCAPFKGLCRHLSTLVLKEYLHPLLRLVEPGMTQTGELYPLFEELKGLFQGEIPLLRKKFFSSPPGGEGIYLYIVIVGAWRSRHGIYSPAGTALNRDAGSTRALSSLMPQCRCGPVTRPVAPTRPMQWPIST